MDENNIETAYQEQLSAEEKELAEAASEDFNSDLILEGTEESKSNDNIESEET